MLQDKNMLTSVAVGAAIAAFVIIGLYLMATGQNEGSIGAFLTAAFATEVARRTSARKDAADELDALADEAEADTEEILQVQKDLQGAMDDTAAAVDNTTLDELVAEEKDRKS